MSAADVYLGPCEACGFQREDMTSRPHPRRSDPRYSGVSLRVCGSCAERLDAMAPPLAGPAAEQALVPGAGLPPHCPACGWASERFRLTLRPDPHQPGAHLSVCEACAERLDRDFPPLAGHRGYAARVDGSGWW
jgi:hypothetical protein